ncbi:MAG: F0F1 ATP synthase subunit epsilon [Phycisphaerales bacterium]
MVVANDFEFSLVTPERLVMEGRATYAELPAHDGQLGVAAHRAAMLVKLGVGKLRLEMAAPAPGSVVPGSEKVFVLDGGFAQMQDNKLSLISERAIDAAELTSAAARDALTQAEAMPKTNGEQLAKRDHDLAMARAMTAVVGA